MLLGVCGLHKKGYCLESQLVELGGEFAAHKKTSDEYELYKLNTNPVKPGMVRRKKGMKVDIDIYRLPKKSYGAFMEKIPSPLSIGTIRLDDGSLVKGFLCEEIALQEAEQIEKF